MFGISFDLTFPNGYLSFLCPLYHSFSLCLFSLSLISLYLSLNLPLSMSLFSLQLYSILSHCFFLSFLLSICLFTYYYYSIYIIYIFASFICPSVSVFLLQTPVAFTLYCPNFLSFFLFPFIFSTSDLSVVDSAKYINTRFIAYCRNRLAPQLFVLHHLHAGVRKSAAKYFVFKFNSVLGASYLTANMYCICLSACFMFA